MAITNFQMGIFGRVRIEGDMNVWRWYIGTIGPFKGLRTPYNASFYGLYKRIVKYPFYCVVCMIRRISYIMRRVYYVGLPRKVRRIDRGHNPFCVRAFAL